ncbi:hypothetical protein BFP76_11350 [Amylibacter kogurei]|uniref:Lysine transporter LysE n=1 Tax=Paramylibacter kogurei TaxID=1889778 RepID=A0A2G5KCC2_9RHOB|nr:LysE family translocator [Amylibacter kogurei]PIB26500.1 hypothetical protein BFP76_11350 [Amylibacter kogurei]
MSFESLVSLFTIAMVAGWTPGPNNTLVANSAARFGFAKTMPHIAGIGIGFPFMVFCIAFGLGALFQQSAVLREGLRAIGIIVLLWFAYKVATAGKPDPTKSADKPFTFFQSAAFQWINPKGWVMAISITSQFIAPQNSLISAFTIASVFVFVGFTSASGWTLFGTAMQRWLTNDTRVNIFNYTMAALLVFSVILIAKAKLGS